MTHIDVTAAVPAAASLADPEAFLPHPARPAGPGRWAVEFAVGPFHHEAVVELGPLWRTEGRTGRAIEWAAAVDEHDALPYEAMMPAVHGVVVLEPGELSLRVQYTPAAGIVGRVLDPALRPLARRSITIFLHRIAERVTVAADVAASAGGA